MSGPRGGESTPAALDLDLAARALSMALSERSGSAYISSDDGPVLARGRPFAFFCFVASFPPWVYRGSPRQHKAATGRLVLYMDFRAGEGNRAPGEEHEDLGLVRSRSLRRPVR